jgi:hypothetical protein
MNVPRQCWQQCSVGLALLLECWQQARGTLTAAWAAAHQQLEMATATATAQQAASSFRRAGRMQKS